MSINSIKVKAEVVLGTGEFLKLDETVTVNDVEVSVICLDPSGQTLQLSASSIVITSDQPINTDILDGSPQSGVRLLVLLADPI
ncbi:MAG: hypothetical protein ACXABY_07310 [Candidatus Thorarchaeota archaeon]|jgi:hypothetical protein